MSYVIIAAVFFLAGFLTRRWQLKAARKRILAGMADGAFLFTFEDKSYSTLWYKQENTRVPKRLVLQMADEGILTPINHHAYETRWRLK